MCRMILADDVATWFVATDFAAVQTDASGHAVCQLGQGLLPDSIFI